MRKWRPPPLRRTLYEHCGAAHYCPHSPRSTTEIDTGNFPGLNGRARDLRSGVTLRPLHRTLLLVAVLLALARCWLGRPRPSSIGPTTAAMPPGTRSGGPSSTARSQSEPVTGARGPPGWRSWAPISTGPIWITPAAPAQGRAREHRRHGREPELYHWRRAPHRIAVNSSLIYWANRGPNATGSRIGRANLDGTARQPLHHRRQRPRGRRRERHARLLGQPITTASPCGGSIGRANLDGTGVEPDFITGAGDPVGVAVDGAHVYWANSCADRSGAPTSTARA